MSSSLTHHAYASAGLGEVTLAGILKLIEKEGVRTRGNPDFRYEMFDVFGIDEARELKEAAYRKAVSGGSKVFVISARGVTKEAQNALLKVVEEPPEGTQFFFIVPSLKILLPTLCSRLHVLPGVLGGEATGASASAGDFLGSSTPKRLKMIQGMLTSAEEETGKQSLTAFVDDLERVFAEKHGLKTRMYADTHMAEAFKEVLAVKKYSHDRAPSFKLLLEHLALILPQVK